MQLRQVYMRGLGRSSGSSSNRPAGPGSSCLWAPNSSRGLSSGVRADAIQIAGKPQHPGCCCALWHVCVCVQLWPTLTLVAHCPVENNKPLCVHTEHAAYISEVAVMPCPKRLPTLLKVRLTRLKCLHLGSTFVSAAANTVQQRVWASRDCACRDCACILLPGQKAVCCPCAATRVLLLVLLQVLEAQGHSVLSPSDRAGLHPLVVPISTFNDTGVTGVSGQAPQHHQPGRQQQELG